MLRMAATQVMHAAEQALRQLQVSDVERNAILEAFRYKEAKMAAAVKEANARADAVVEEAAAKVVEVGATPFTRRGPVHLSQCSVRRVLPLCCCRALLGSLCPR